MTRGTSGQLIGAALGFALAVAAVPAGASCAQVNQLLARGFSVDQIAMALGAPVEAVQGCLQPVSNPGARVHIANGATGRAPFDAAGPAPLGAAGPPPLGAAGPPPLGAAGPPPLGAAGPPPIGGVGPAPSGATGRTTR